MASWTGKASAGQPKVVSSNSTRTLLATPLSRAVYFDRHSPKTYTEDENKLIFIHSKIPITKSEVGYLPLNGVHHRSIDIISSITLQHHNQYMVTVKTII